MSLSFQEREVDLLAKEFELAKERQAEFLGDRYCLLTEGVHGIRPSVTHDLITISPVASQTSRRQFGRRI